MSIREDLVSQLGYWFGHHLGYIGESFYDKADEILSPIKKEIKEMENPYPLEKVDTLSFPGSVGVGAVNACHAGYEKCRKDILSKLEEK